MTILLTLVLLGIIFAIYKVFQNDARKKEIRTNYVAVALASLLFVLFFGFFIILSTEGTSDFDPYEDHPSITDDEWLKDNYGGTEYYP